MAAWTAETWVGPMVDCSAAQWVAQRVVHWVVLTADLLAVLSVGWWGKLTVVQTVVKWAASLGVRKAVSRAAWTVDSKAILWAVN